MFRFLQQRIAADTFIRASGTNDLKTVQKYIAQNKKQPDAINTADQYGITALINAIVNGHADTVSILLAANANTETGDLYGNTPLMYAAKYGYGAIILALIKAGAMVNAVNKAGNTALIMAVWLNRPMVVSDLLKAQADSNIINRLGGNALIVAARYNHFSIIDLLLADPHLKRHAINALGQHALIVAAGYGHSTAVRTLLKGGLNINHSDQYGNTALAYATRNRHVGTVLVLLAANANTDAANVDGFTPLMLAQTDEIRYLIQNDALDKRLENFSKKRTFLATIAMQETEHPEKQKEQMQALAALTLQSLDSDLKFLSKHSTMLENPYALQATLQQCSNTLQALCDRENAKNNNTQTLLVPAAVPTPASITATSNTESKKEKESKHKHSKHHHHSRHHAGLFQAPPSTVSQALPGAIPPAKPT